MSIKPPVYSQEKDSTCGRACLRMVLAAYGQNIGRAPSNGTRECSPAVRTSESSTPPPRVHNEFRHPSFRSP